ncbi:MAG TPA: lanthionine synthetase C family protein [Thermoanaerobaculia bacterium]|nr:lanthionine synthetase C family protein [Thermoanaerobaculia bacterium]
MSEHEYTWRPLLTGPAAERARDVVLSIGNDIREMDRATAVESDTDDPFIALLFAYLGKAMSDARSSEFAENIFDAACEHLRGMGQRPALYGGAAGIVWLDAHLNRWFRKADEGEPGADGSAHADEDRYGEVDEVLTRVLAAPPGAYPYELISGFAGFGMAWLERLPEAIAAQHLERIVDSVDASAVTRADWLLWRTPPHWMVGWRRAIAPNGYFNLGVSHGMPGLLVVLARIAHAGIATEKARRLVDGGVEWLLKQRRNDTPAHWFPSWITDDAIPDQASGLRWCYGGLGIGAALATIAQLLQNSRWTKAALEILRSAASVRTMEEAGLVDAGLCHGASGCAHLFNRSFQTTGDPALAEAARHWFDVVLDLRKPGCGLGGYEVWSIPRGTKFDPFSPEKIALNEWVTEARWLTGASGIGLALLAAFSPLEPHWDRLLAIST